MKTMSFFQVLLAAVVLIASATFTFFAYSIGGVSSAIYMIVFISIMVAATLAAHRMLMGYADHMVDEPIRTDGSGLTNTEYAELMDAHYQMCLVDELHEEAIYLNHRVDADEYDGSSGTEIPGWWEPTIMDVDFDDEGGATIEYDESYRALYDSMRLELYNRSCALEAEEHELSKLTNSNSMYDLQYEACFEAYHACEEISRAIQNWINTCMEEAYHMDYAHSNHAYDANTDSVEYDDDQRMDDHQQASWEASQLQEASFAYQGELPF